MPTEIPSQLLPTSMPTSHFGFARFDLVVPRGVLPEHVVNPDFWVHVASRLRVNARIEVTAEDGSFDMYLRVLAIDPRGLWAQVRVLDFVGPEGREVPGVGAVPAIPESDIDPDGYKIEFAGPHKFRIVRGNDVIETHLPTKAAAYAKLAEIKAEKAAA